MTIKCGPFGHWMRTLLVGMAAAVLLGVFPAKAAVITLHEDKMDWIYGQANIDVRFLSSITIYDSDLLTIDDATEWTELKGLYTRNAGTNALAAFFVDSIAWCGTYLAGITGCGSMPGWHTMLRSTRIAEEYGYTTFAHEIGHNLGLPHDPDSDNLMYPYASDSKYLLGQDQVDSILDSEAVWSDVAGNHWINIQPILIAESMAAPLPSTLVLMLGGLAVLARVPRRRSPAA